MRSKDCEVQRLRVIALSCNRLSESLRLDQSKMGVSFFRRPPPPLLPPQRKVKRRNTQTTRCVGLLSTKKHGFAESPTSQEVPFCFS